MAFRKLFYFPLESYKERYTMQLSAPVVGWLERRWVHEGMDYVRIEGESLRDSITDGSVLDVLNRSHWSTTQIANFVKLMASGEVTNDDVLYFDDFWHPGFSALPYMFKITGIKPRVYAMLHAQSIDKNDFTYPMRHWMRHFEHGISKVLDGIFVTSTCLQDLCFYHGVGTPKNVFLTGLPYNSEEVTERMMTTSPSDRKKRVTFSSRWDKEKDPMFFLDVAREVKKVNPEIEFVITTCSKTLRSNDVRLLNKLKKAIKEKTVILKENLSKEEYYQNLLETAIQFNCADQDFVSWTLLEATTAGCSPSVSKLLKFSRSSQE